MTCQRCRPSASAIGGVKVVSVVVPAWTPSISTEYVTGPQSSAAGVQVSTGRRRARHHVVVSATGAPGARSYAARATVRPAGPASTTAISVSPARSAATCSPASGSGVPSETPASGSGGASGSSLRWASSPNGGAWASAGSSCSSRALSSTALPGAGAASQATTPSEFSPKAVPGCASAPPAAPRTTGVPRTSSRITQARTDPSGVCSTAIPRPRPFSAIRGGPTAPADGSPSSVSGVSKRDPRSRRATPRHTSTLSVASRTCWRITTHA
ncbi:unannotated protein [freshwater metagenome]|uniref:Unannotated protein n=1 Tax=freshwater metagenome TaxID=449393 RepID=A0A6J7CSF4_9ZZZZ